MSFRHCPTCGTDVEDVGGFCLLGHPLRHAAPTDSLAALRAEVNKAFSDVEVKVAEVLGVGSYGPAVPTPPTTARAAAQPPSVQEATGSLATVAVTATPPTTATAPPPPPPPSTRATEFEPSLGPDPITDFAPAPNMDWGPERGRLLRRFG